ncbi:MAG: VCBS repeat-containing protein [Caldilinea sp.]|nr:VCBS repeat-containing protein [Caldilinea sp.]
MITPTTAFFPGEMVRLAVSAGVQNQLGGPAMPEQIQFTAAATAPQACNAAFTAIAPGLPAVDASAVAWGDYDNDGDLDLLFAGASGTTRIARLYRNDGGVFVDSGTADNALIGVGWGHVAWGDYDNDGDLDILLTGWNNVGYAKIYRNDGGVFVDSGTTDDALIGVWYSSVAWGDYDNDGDLDILLTGGDAAGPVTKVYRNDNGSFEDSGTADDALTGVSSSSVAWGDYDNDGDLDVLLTGVDASPSFVAKVYRNDNGSFEDSGTADDILTGVGMSSVAWGDYDNDGDLDILLTGVNDSSGELTQVYRNDNGSFVDSGTTDDALTGVAWSSVAWGDYDNDGDLDILLTGDDNINSIAKVYRNDNGGFVDSGPIDDALTGVSSSSVAWGDYDNDGDLDILLTGNTGINLIAKVYRNDDCADVGIVKTVTPGLALPGAAITYTLSFSNAGPGAAYGVTVTDSMPVSVTISGVTSSTFGSSVVITQTDGSPNFAWTTGDLAVGVGGTITLTGTVYDLSGLEGSAIVNMAAIVASNDVTLTNNTSNAMAHVPLHITEHAPVTNAVGVNVTAPITASFDAAVQASTVTTRTFTVRSSFRGLYTDTATLNGNTVTLDPSRDFFAGEQVQAVGTAAISSTGAAPLAPTQWGFTAGMVTNRCGVFADSGLADDALTGVWVSSVAWGDYDKDGDLDILLTGGTSSDPVAKVYRNDNGSFVESGDVDDALIGIRYSSVAWGDYDNDGDPDILFTGRDAGSGRVAKVYRNDNGSFVDSGTIDDILTGVWSSSVAWGDYDNDGDLDILLTGYAGSGPVTKVYRNDNGSFGDSGTTDDAVTGVAFSSVAWGDYDNDGDLDILLTGWDGSNNVAKVYRNEDCPDVQIAKQATPAIVTPGAAITYTLSFSNAGPGIAYSVTVTDSMPVSVTISGVTSSTFGSGVVITQTGGSPNFAWVTSDLGVGAGGIITLTGTVSNSGLVAGTTITNTATIAVSNDITTTNNNSSAALAVSEVACYATPDDGATVFAGNDALPVQQAIDAAGAGGTVKVAGACIGVVNRASTNQTGYIAKNLSLRGGYTNTLASWAGAGDPVANPTTLDAASQGGRVLRVSGNYTVTVQNLRLTGGSAANGAGIYNSGATLTVSNCLIYSNTASTNGGGIYNESAGSVTLSASSVVSNSASNNGGGILNTGSGSVVSMTSSGVQHNNAGSGGGIYNGVAGNVMLSASSVVSNSASIGGAIFNGGAGSVALSASSIFLNSADNVGGGIYNQSAGSVTLSASSVVSNSAINNGGGIYNTGSGSVITMTNDGLVQGNSASNLGGGIFNRHTGLVTLSDSSVILNSAGVGGGIYNDLAGGVTLSTSSVLSNSAGSLGGGIYITDTGSILSMTNSRLLHNSAGSGGGLYQAGGSSLVTASCIVDNSDTAVAYIGGTVPITATANWWGYASGPSGAGPGVGDSVSNNVDFSGFLTASILGCPTFSDSDVGIVKSATPSLVVSGAAITYTLSFSNAGPGIAYNVSVTDSVPAGVAISDVFSNGVAITQTSGSPNFAWTVGNLAVGAGGVITLTGRVDDPLAIAGFIIVNTAAITAGNDITPANNVAFSVTNLKKATQSNVQSSLNPSLYSQAVTLTASVAISGVTVAARPIGPTGQVRFSDESGELATVNLVDGVATFSRDTWAVGTHTVTAEYLGDSLFVGSSSDPLYQVVGKHGTATSLATSPNPAPIGETVVMTATVEKQLAVLTLLPPADPTGQVQFRIEGGDVLGTADLVGNTAVFTKNDLSSGVYTIVAEYLGDVNYAGSTSDPVQQEVPPRLAARNDAAGTLQGEAVQIDPLANDIDAAGAGLVVAAVEQPVSGSVAIDSGDKTVTYTPDPAFSGVVTFTYTARDSNAAVDSAVVAVVVSARDVTGVAPQIGVVDNESGSTHDFDSGSFQVQVQMPAGSYPGPLGEKDIFYLVYTEVVTPTGDVNQPPGSFTWAGMVFHLSAFVNGTDLGHFEFPQPVTLVIAYDPALLGELSEQLLTPYYWNSTTWVNDGMSITHIDTTAHRITIQIWHLSEFALFSQPPLDFPSYLYLPVVTNRGDSAAVLEAAEPASTLDVEALVDEPAIEEAATPAPDVDETATPEETATPDAAPVAEETAAPEATPTDEAAQRLHLPVIVR